MQYEINRLAELKDKNREADFYDIEVRQAVRTCRNTVLAFGIVNLLFTISDAIFLKYPDLLFVIYHSLIPRMIVLCMAVIVFILLKKAEDKKSAIKSVLVFVVLTYLLHEYTAIHFAPVDLIYEALDLVFLTFGLFITPNRWITNICTSVLMIGIFLALTPFTMPTMTVGTKITVAFYLFSQVLIVGILLFRINKQKRLNYLQQLQYEALANTDMLTKIFNRAACDRTLDQMCGSRRAFSLILFDLDDFKQINDTHGHIAGDGVIVKIIDTVKREVEPDYILARWGGEEFVIILPHVTLEKAAETAERMRELVSLIEHKDSIGGVTASFGVTSYVEGDDTKSILNRSDQLLYQAKRQGKNKVVFQ